MMAVFARPRPRTTAAAVVLLAALAAAGYAAREWPSWAASRAARRALAEGRYQDARSVVEGWLRARPEAAEAHYLRAKAAIALGRRHEIAAGLTRAKALGYPADRIAVLLALLDAQAGRPGRARPVLARAFAEAHGPDPMLDEALARIYLETYDWAHAGAVLSAWSRDAPRDPRPPLWHAAALRRRGADPRTTLAEYREALRRDPKSAEARLGLAEVLAEDHRAREAADAFAAYLADRPDDPAARLGAGRVALELGDEAGAVRQLDRALDLDPDLTAALMERGKLDLRRDDPAAALARFDRAAARAPFDPAPHYQRSLVLKRLGRAEESARAQATFARLRQDRRRLDDLQERLAAAPSDPRLQSQVCAWMFDHGYDAEALQWSRKILTDAPGHPETCRLLADYYDRHGDPASAAPFRLQAARAPSPR